MLNLLDNPTSDNERNVLNADLFVNNLKNSLKAFGINPKITYEVYRRITIYHIHLNDDKTYEDLYELRREIALSLAVRWEDLEMTKVRADEALIKVWNMKIEPLFLKEVLSSSSPDKSHLQIALGMDEYDNVSYLDFSSDRGLLVSGASGSGKSNLFNNIIMNILINYPSAEMIILDSQSINYNLYDKVIEVVNSEEEIISKIREIRKEFEERIRTGKNNPLVVFIDEIYEIIAKDNSIKDDINYLLEVSSQAQIYLVMSTDSVMDDDIYDLFKKDNIAKLSFYMTSRGEYYTFLKEVVKNTPSSSGIYVSKDKEVKKISVPIVSDKEIERVVASYEKEKK